MTANSGRIWEYKQHSNGTGILIVHPDLHEDMYEVAKAEGQIKKLVLEALGILVDSYTDTHGFTSLLVREISTNVDEEVAFDIICDFHRSKAGRELLRKAQAIVPNFSVLPDSNTNNCGIDNNGNYIVFDPFFIQ